MISEVTGSRVGSINEGASPFTTLIQLGTFLRQTVEEGRQVVPNYNT